MRFFGRKLTALSAAFMLIVFLCTAGASALNEKGYTETFMTFGDGTRRLVYVLQIFDNTDDWNKIGAWGSVFSLKSNKICPFEFAGKIENCYGVSFRLSVLEAKNEKALAEGIQPAMRMDGKWVFGDYSESIAPKVGESGVMTILNETPGTLTAITQIMSRSKGGANYKGALENDITLYFAAERDAKVYLASIQALG